MEVWLKIGVVIDKINTPLVTLCEAVALIWGEYGVHCVITSGTEGKHMEGSLHYKNLAWDLRTRNLKDPGSAADKLREKLGKDWDVLYGDKYHLDHIHVEFQPKGKKNG